MTSLSTTTSSQNPTPYTVASLLLGTLAAHNIDYLFTVLGSDHASLLEAYHHLLPSHPLPRLLHFQHEFTALSAADSYARLTSRPQAVIVHTDVGTAALEQALHNASSGRAPVLIFAGLAPLTLEGEVRGSRSEHVQWYQDVRDQGSLVRPYVRWEGEIKMAEQVRGLVGRALMMATSGSPGPVYLTAAREVLALPVSEEMMVEPAAGRTICRLGGLPPDAVETIGEALLSASNPLVVTGYLGRNHAAVQQLVHLTDLLPGLRVFDSEMREMSFPADHPAWSSRSTGAAQAIKTADVILVLDCDVPWIPSKVKPSASARIFHVDIDPRKEKMQMFDIHAEESYFAECEIALRQICEYVESHEGTVERRDVFGRRRSELIESHARGLEMLELKAEAPADGSISSAYLFASMKRFLPKDTIYVHDAVTNMGTFFEQLQCTIPGSSLSKGGSGLGWAGGAAIGAKLALDKYDISDRPHIKPRSSSTSPPMVCSITGDGSFIFGVPSATYWAQYRLRTPFLTIILNNGGWKATRLCLNDVHPEGIAAGLSDEQLGIDLRVEGPDYVGIAVAASGNTLWGKKVSRNSELEALLLDAVDVVQKEKRGALLEVVIGG